MGVPPRALRVGGPKRGETRCSLEPFVVRPFGRWRSLPFGRGRPQPRLIVGGERELQAAGRRFPKHFGPAHLGLAERAFERWGVATDVDNVLLCGSGARRGGAVSGIGGHNAAMAVLEQATG